MFLPYQLTAINNFPYRMNSSCAIGIKARRSRNNRAIKWNKNMPDGAPRKVMDDSRFRKVTPNFQFAKFKIGLKETVKYYESIYPY